MRRAALAVALVSVAAGCRWIHPPEAPPSTPEACALRLFRLAGEESPSKMRLTDVVDERALASGPLPVADALSALRPASSPRILRVDPLPGPDAAAVDLEATLPGDGRARFTVHTVRLPDGTWRVSGFWGPGVDWPPRPHPAGDATTTSPAPPR